MIETDISKVPLKTFVECCVSEDLTSLGDGTPDELQEAFNSILSQYYEIRQNQLVSEYTRLKIERLLLIQRQAIVKGLCEIVKDRYSPEACDALRSYWPQFEFTEQSADNDLQKALTGEISNEIRQEEIEARITQLEEQQKQNGQDLTPLQKRRNFYARVMDINKVEGVTYNINTMTVLEYAIAESRLDEHIENLEKQSHVR